MTDPLDLPPLDGAPAPVAAPTVAPSGDDLHRLTDVSVELTVEVGRTRMTLGETLALGPGSVVTLDRLADQPVDLLVNGRRIARGEVVVIDEQFGLRITEVVGGQTSDSTAAPGPTLPSPDDAPQQLEAAS